MSRHLYSAPLHVGSRRRLISIVPLGLVPFLTLRMHRRWSRVLAAAGQAVLQLAGVGVFLLWLPALLLTAVAGVV